MGLRRPSSAGIEIIMQGRDPRDAWAFTQRICGVCTVVHAVASCRAVEDALGITIPPNANLIRNLVHGMQFIQDHVIHFYHLHALDWVDVVSALKADPAATAKIARQHLALAQQLGDLLRARCRTGSRSSSAERPARHLHQRLLGPSGLQAAARSEPAGGGALSRGAGLAARRHPAAHHLRRQEPAPELPGRRDGLRHQPRRHRHDQRRAADRHPGHDQAGPGVRGAGLLARPGGHRRLLQGVGRDRRRGAELPGGGRVPRRRRQATSTSSTSPAASSSTGT